MPYREFLIADSRTQWESMKLIFFSLLQNININISLKKSCATKRKKKKPTTFIPPPLLSSLHQNTADQSNGLMSIPFWRRPLPRSQTGGSSENEGSAGSRVNIHQKLQEKKQKQLAELKIIEEEIKQGKYMNNEKTFRKTLQVV